MKKMNESAKKEDSVIWEEDAESIIKFKSAIFDEDKLDKIGFLKKGNKLMKSVKNKLKKNIYLLISLIFIIVIYYTVTFHSILPMFESHLIVKNDFSIMDRNPNVILKSFINNTVNTNRALSYLIILHLFLALFLLSFIMTAIMNPGYYHKDYLETFSLEKYHENYTKFYLKLISEKKKSFESNSSIEFPNMNLKSNNILNKKNMNEDSDKDSIIVDPDENLNLNLKLKRFEKDINKIRNSEKLKKFWELNCFNFKNRSLRENICRFCSTIKSERVYHCKHCRNCVRKMDHHCFFINNCLGFNTYKIFIIMLFYAVCTCAISFIIMLNSLKFILDEYSVK